MGRFVPPVLQLDGFGQVEHVVGHHCRHRNNQYDWDRHKSNNHYYLYDEPDHPGVVWMSILVQLRQLY